MEEERKQEGNNPDFSDAPEDIRERVKDTYDMITAHLNVVFGAVRSVGEAAKELAQKILEAYCGYGVTVKQTPPRRFTRKLKRWDERNRKKKKKGLPEKPNPYYNSAFFTIEIPVSYMTCAAEVAKEDMEDGHED